MKKSITIEALREILKACQEEFTAEAKDVMAESFDANDIEELTNRLLNVSLQEDRDIMFRGIIKRIERGIKEYQKT